MGRAGILRANAVSPNDGTVQVPGLATTFCAWTQRLTDQQGKLVRWRCSISGQHLTEVSFAKLPALQLTLHRELPQDAAE